MIWSLLSKNVILSVTVTIVRNKFVGASVRKSAWLVTGNMFISELWFRIDLPAVLRTVAWNVSQPNFATHFFGTSYLIYEKTMHLLIINNLKVLQWFSQKMYSLSKGPYNEMNAMLFKGERNGNCSILNFKHNERMNWWPWKIENITWQLGETKFLFECWKTFHHFTNERIGCRLMMPKYTTFYFWRWEENFVSPSGRVMI